METRWRQEREPPCRSKNARNGEANFGALIVWLILKWNGRHPAREKATSWMWNPLSISHIGPIGSIGRGRSRSLAFGGLTPIAFFALLPFISKKVLQCTGTLNTIALECGFDWTDNSAANERKTEVVCARHLLPLSNINVRFRLILSLDRIALKRRKIEQIQGYRLVHKFIKF